ncbi:FAD-binding oxidoreductase [Marinobacter sp.]|uniref:FAD-binding oxidoreductase n=1 Tax=Marinobacter sp. TaxID=50741 RepID=UPI0035691699
MSDLIASLKNILGEQGVLTGEDVRSRASTYWDRGPMRAKAILRPGSTEEVSACLRLCHSLGQPVIPLGGNTGLAEGTASQDDDVMLSLERMRDIESIDVVGQAMAVQAGAVLQVVQEHANEHGLRFPVDFGARGSCTIGGMVATNAGGFNVMRHGMMRQRLLGLEVVLADGRVLSSMTSYLKNNTGYDLKQLFAGSEGTLGVVTRAVLRLNEQPVADATAMVALASFEQVVAFLRFLDSALGDHLCAYEVMWSDFFELNTGPHADSKSPFSQTYPFVVLVEAQGNDQVLLPQLFEKTLEQAFMQDSITDAVVAGSEAERAALWGIREGTEAEDRFFRKTIGFDVSLPISSMNTYVEKVQSRLKSVSESAVLLVFGHLADGNLHLTVGLHEEDVPREAVEQVIYSTLQAFGGSVSAEHGIGLEKREYLHMSRNPEELSLMRQIKQTLDPANILNPGKIFIV